MLCWGKLYESQWESNWTHFIAEKNRLQCHKTKTKGGEDEKKECKENCGKDGNGGGGKDGNGGGNGGSGGGGGGSSTPILDPSGFVYEGVTSNRLEGVTATVFYKQIGKNQFGDDVEKVMIWDAESFAQVNPQITDKNGEYGWMVPAGQWQVKYEKSGYQTEYSEWLPVPPPQLDVNQPMVQYSEPLVIGVKATPQMVELTFDKYMLADSLTTNTIFVTQGGKKINGTIDTMIGNEDPMSTTFTNKARFVPTTALPVGQSLTLTVKHNVMSYAGVPMNQDFSQDFDIKADVVSLITDSIVYVVYDQPTALTIQAQPANIAAGKKVRVNVLSDMIASANATELTFDAQGKAVLTLTGEASGTTAVILQMVDDSSVEAVTVVKVRNEEDYVCPVPVANYVDGIELTYGTTISLSCELPEAVIYYTLDGTCPCDSKAAIRYDAPITINGDMTIKAYAVAPGYADSEVVEFNYYLTYINEVTTGGNPIVREGIYDLQGRKLSSDSWKEGRMKKGIYIINGQKVVVK